MNFIPSDYFTLQGLGAWSVWSKTRYRYCKIFSKQNHKLISRHTNKLFADRLHAYLRESLYFNGGKKGDYSHGHVGQAGEGVVPLLALLLLPQPPRLLELRVLVLVDETGDVVKDGAGVVAVALELHVDISQARLFATLT